MRRVSWKLEREEPRGVLAAPPPPLPPPLPPPADEDGDGEVISLRPGDEPRDDARQGLAGALGGIGGGVGGGDPRGGVGDPRAPRLPPLAPNCSFSNGNPDVGNLGGRCRPREPAEEPKSKAGCKNPGLSSDIAAAASAADR